MKSADLMCIHCESEITLDQVGFEDQLEGFPPTYTCKDCTYE